MTRLYLRLRLWLAQIEYDDRLRKWHRYQGERDAKALAYAANRVADAFGRLLAHSMAQKSPTG